MNTRLKVHCLGAWESFYLELDAPIWDTSGQQTYDLFLCHV